MKTLETEAGTATGSSVWDILQCKVFPSIGFIQVELQDDVNHNSSCVERTL